MRAALIVIGILIVLGTITFLLFKSARPDDSDALGFKDVLKDGRKREILNQQMNPQDLDKLTDAEVRELVEEYVRTQHQSAEYWAVGALKERSVPYLLEVLKRPESFVKPEPKGILDQSPAQRALDMLWRYPQDAVIPLLLPYVDSAEKWQRREAARHLALSGKNSVKDAVVHLLKDPDDYVRSAAVHGLLSAVEADRAEPILLAAAFEPVTMMTTQRDKAMIGADAVELLLLIDHPRAAEFLTSATVIQYTNSNVDRLLECLTVEQIAVPPDLLLELVESYDSAPEGRGNSYTYGEALKNLALQKHPATELLIRHCLSEPPVAGEADLPAFQRSRFDRRNLAAQALCILNDLPDAVQAAFSNEEKLGFEFLPIPQQRLILVVHLDGQVSNGGFSQYFFNSSDDSASVAAALDDIGATNCARIFREAVSVFGRTGPSRDDELRQRQLEKLSTRQDQVLEKASQEWWEEHLDLGALLYLYALQHRNEFTPATGRRQTNGA